MIEEACVPWNPIPERFNHNWAVDLAHFEEAHTADNTARRASVSVAIAAFVEDAERREAGAWRLDFLRCRAFQRRIIGYRGSAPLTSPDNEATFWDIAPSRLIVESGALGAHSGPVRPIVENGELGAPVHITFHHYVIVSAMFDAYEFVAEGWSCESLPEEWAKPFDGPTPRW